MTEEQPLSEHAVAFLTQECDRFLSLYTQAQDTIQSIFNFYLTFATAVIGGLFFVLQSDIENRLLTVSAALFLSALIGSVYLSAISGRYAQSSRYAYIVDELRRYLIETLKVTPPRAYASLLTVDNNPNRREAWYAWLFPTGTYQMFIALLNSGALASIAVLLAGAGDAGSGRGITAGVLIFFFTLTVYNVYSRVVIRRFNSDLHARLDIGRELSLWASSR